MPNKTEPKPKAEPMYMVTHVDGDGAQVSGPFTLSNALQEAEELYEDNVEPIRVCRIEYDTQLRKVES